MAAIQKNAPPPRVIPTRPPNAVAPAPVAVAPVAVAPVAVAPVAVAPVAVATEKKEGKGKRRGREAGKPYSPTYAFDAQGNPLIDLVDGESIPRRVKLDSTPILGKNHETNEYDHSFHEPLSPSNFVKVGDFWRHKSNVALAQSASFLETAKLADEGKMTGKTSVLAARVDALQAQVAANTGVWKMLYSINPDFARQSFTADVAKSFGVDSLDALLATIPA